jgi:hypothetical protein
MTKLVKVSFVVDLFMNPGREKISVTFLEIRHLFNIIFTIRHNNKLEILREKIYFVLRNYL